MKSRNVYSNCITAGIAFFLLIVLACAGPLPNVPEDQIRHVEGTLMEGGVHGFWLKNPDGEAMRFKSRSNVDYQPAEDFHAYYGDRLAVSYFTEENSNWHSALKVVLLEKNLERKEPQRGNTVGVIRETGFIRHMVYLPNEDITVPFYIKSGARYTPENWSPKEGEMVMIHYDEQVGRFLKKYEYNNMVRLEEKSSVELNKTAVGRVTAIEVQRSVHKAPSTFSFRTEDGETWKIYTGGETELAADDLKVMVGGVYKIQYYRKLMNDLSLRYVAATIGTAE